MAKKILAAMLALTMCAGLAGCKNVSENKDSSSAKEKSTAAADTDTTNNENTQAADSKTDESDTTAHAGLNKDNIFINDVNTDYTDIPTNDELLTFVELAVEQYNAAQMNDSEKYTQMLNFDKAVEPFAEILTKMESDNNYEPSSNKELVMYIWGSTLYRCSDFNGIDDSTADNTEEDFKKKMYLALDGLNLDKTPLWEDRENLAPISELNGDTIVYIDLTRFSSEGDDKFIYFDMTLLNGNDMFAFEGIEEWYIDGDSGVFITGAEHRDNEYAGLTIDEIKQKIEEKDAERNIKNIAHSVYNIICEYQADQETLGEDFKKKLDSVFPMCTSSEGLDLAGDEPEAEGDKYVYDQMHEYGYPDGKAFISGYDEDRGFIEKAGYTSADGVTGYYPTEE